MILRYQYCPGIDTLNAFLDIQLFDTNNSTKLFTQSTTLNEYNVKLSEPINKLTLT